MSNAIQGKIFSTYFEVGNDTNPNHILVKLRLQGLEFGERFSSGWLDDLIETLQRTKLVLKAYAKPDAYFSNTYKVNEAPFGFEVDPVLEDSIKRMNG